jgi:hypothetical protein
MCCRISARLARVIWGLCADKCDTESLPYHVGQQEAPINVAFTQTGRTLNFAVGAVQAAKVARGSAFAACGAATIHAGTDSSERCNRRPNNAAAFINEVSVID